MNKVWAILPIKSLEGVKSRLSDVLTPKERAALVEAMARDVVGALKETPGLAGIAVITHDPRVVTWARGHDLEVIDDEHTKGLSAAVAHASEVLCDQFGATAILSVLADIPLATSVDFSHLLEAYLEEPSPALILARSRDGDGSNAMLFPPRTMAFHYGPGSAESHLMEAKSRGLVTKSLDLAGPGHDIDTPEDLRDLQTILAPRPEETATGQVLTKLGIAGRL